MVDPTKGFILYARVTVEYDGRAKSIIGPANLCLLHKPDGSLIIHGAVNCLPINYQRPGSTLELVGNKLICTSKRRDERITITIIDEWYYQELDEWSCDRLKMTGTEKQLCDRICANIDQYLGVRIVFVDREVRVEYGAIDILAIDTFGVRHVIEAKRARITANTLFQLKKYCDLVAAKHQCRGYVAAPTISSKAQTLATQFGFGYICAI